MKQGIDMSITKYSDFIEVEEAYNYSINLRYDLNNLQKVRAFIPTEKNVTLLKNLLSNVLSKNKKANIVIGPYGKGKSYVYLILLFILSLPKETSNENSAKITVLNELVEKIGRIDSQVVEMIDEIIKKKISYLPVIINYSYKDIQQMFFTALNEVIERENLSRLKIFTSFDAAIEKINSWSNEYPEASKKFEEYLEQLNISKKDFVNKLKECDFEAYDLFITIYRKVTAGAEFNPFLNDDVVNTYKTFSYKLRETGLYNGIYIVFDEFSKFIEEAVNEKRNPQLKIIQDIAEAVERDDEGLIYFDGIMHKPFDHYLKNASSIRQDQFRAVEGRFREIYFINTMKDDYSLIEQVIKKDETRFNIIWNRQKSKIEEIFLQAKSLFSPIYSEEELKELAKKSFPLNPVTLFVLPKLCELVAQNERTLFTFLTGRERGGFLHFLEKKLNGDNIELLNVDMLFDYFEFSFKKEIFNKKIIEIYSIVQRALQLTDSDDERKILKALAIFYMVDEMERLPPKEEFLKCALQIDEDKFDQIVQDLLKKKVIIRRKSNQFLDFLASRIEDLDEKINLYKTLKVKEINVGQTIEKIRGLEFNLPRRYNDEFEMTRYFYKIFMELNELERINRYKDIENIRFADGYVIYLIWYNKEDIAKAIEKITQINDKRIVLCVPQRSFERIEDLREYLALQLLIEEAKKEQDETLIYNLEILLEDIEQLLYNYLEGLFDYNECQFYTCEKGFQKIETEKQLSSFLSDICEEVYCLTPIINNEMINKNNLTPQMQKALASAIEHILKGNYDIEGNKPEKTIIKCAIINKGLLRQEIKDSNLEKVLKEVEIFLQKACGYKKSFCELYETLQNPPYGLRRGVIPLFLAFKIKNLLSNTVFYYNDKEIEFNPAIFNGINENPGQYSLLVDENAVEKESYLEKLESLFSDYLMDNNKSRYAKIYQAMKRWYFSLPPITQNTDKIEIKEVCSVEQLKTFKREISKIDQNPFEFVSYKLLKIFGSNSYKEVAEKIKKLKIILDNYLENIVVNVVIEIKNILGIESENTFASGLRKWYLSLPEMTKSRFINDTVNSFLRYLKKLEDYEDKKIVSDLSSILLGIDIYNWNDNSYKNFIEKIKDIIRTLQEQKNKSISDFIKISYNNGDREENKIIEKVEISEIGNTLKDALEEILNEFGNSIDDTEKLNVLASIILEHLK
ncbi:hypothetical protein Calkro_0025 [Caldicellulosiruptor kronotskyensis 2002]|uniref:Uncharacterized protein n=1 Tax=Caldicellulosiruptor kronotskyensis (strain DSM 18902 / VKM B-2412 / 2002) TaxID=632348 RepID=E4SC19_CALK2|nr:hypothetical protein [Caldicellulosiruptor kronotskyensis]ADQ44944.1 hypothetical protein Calkro_0025 [Caldicellulosiruptor kronotskyensis 2002]